MGFRLRKSIKLMPGVRINLGAKSGPSLSIGGKGLTTNVSSRGTRTTASIPGTGLSYSSFTPSGTRSSKMPAAPTPVPIRVKTTTSSTSSTSITVSVTSTNVGTNANANANADKAQKNSAGVPHGGPMPLSWYHTRKSNARLLAPSSQDGEEPIDLQSMLPYSANALSAKTAKSSEAPSPRLEILEIAWLGLFGLSALAVLCSGDPLGAAFVTWVAVLPVGALRTRVAKRWGHYLLLGFGLIMAAGAWSNYSRSMDLTAQDAPHAATPAARTSHEAKR